MYRQARKIAGRFEETDGSAAINVVVTKVYGGVDPYELILFYFPDKMVPAQVIHRVVMDKVGATMSNHEPTMSQGQIRGIHGVEDFTQERIKDASMIVNPLDFCSARGQVHTNIEVTLKEYR